MLWITASAERASCKYYCRAYENLDPYSGRPGPGSGASLESIKFVQHKPLCQICSVCLACKDQNDETRTAQVEQLGPCNSFPCSQRVCMTCASLREGESFIKPHGADE